MKKKFSPSFSPFIGCKYPLYKRLVKRHLVKEERNYHVLMTGFLSWLFTLVSVFDKMRYNRLKKNVDLTTSPIFIIGHWRSGTTFLHDYVCLDKELGYSTTYQTVFSNHLFAFKGILSTLLKLTMPKRRPVDHLELSVNGPQEEEFALSNMCHLGYYKHFVFPQSHEVFWKEDLSHETMSPSDKEVWKKSYKELVTRSLLDRKKRSYVSKNPPNTMRIPLLLELFPNAKFIFIHRNPYETFDSTTRFYRGVIDGIAFQDITTSQLKNNIIRVYQDMMRVYENDKKLIPPQNLVEIRYADFVKTPANSMRQIYDAFEFNVSEDLKKSWEDHARKNAQYKGNTYSFDEDTITLVNNHLSGYMKQYNYSPLSLNSTH